MTHKAWLLLLTTTIGACAQAKPVAPETPAPPLTQTENPAAALESPAKPPAESPPVVASPAHAEQPQACAGKVADVPAALFGDRILIRPPPGVELVEERPGFAMTYAEAVSTCEGIVQRMWLSVYADDPARDLNSYLQQSLQTLHKQGYAQPKIGNPVVDTKGDLYTPVAFPSQQGQPAAKVLLAVARRPGNVMVVFYQTAPEEWSALSQTFIKSAQSLLVVPQDA